MPRQAYFNLPNWITMGRLAAVPIVLLIMLFMDDRDPAYVHTNRVLSFTAAIVFTLAMVSDLLDGYLARN